MLGSFSLPLLSTLETSLVSSLPSSLSALALSSSALLLVLRPFEASSSAVLSLISSSPSPEHSFLHSRFPSLSFLSGVALALFVRLVSPFLLPFLLSTPSPPPSLILPASMHLSLRTLAFPLALFSFAVDGAFRGLGDPRTPLKAALLRLATFALSAPLLLRASPTLSSAALAAVLGEAAAASFLALSLVRTRARLRSSLPPPAAHSPPTPTVPQIARASIAMVVTRLSLLSAWAVAARASLSLSLSAGAVHQVALSIWLLAVFLSEGPAVGIQVVSSRALPDTKGLYTKLLRLTLTIAGLVSLVSCSSLFLLTRGGFLARFFQLEAVGMQALVDLLKRIVWHQPLVHTTLLLESVAVGFQQFRLLLIGNLLSCAMSAVLIKRATSVPQIWTVGINALFAGRLLTALLAILLSRSKSRRAGGKEQ
ncbi:hypothetical protein TeGR_g542 [Tetraparma gracilis]|uniref:Protein RFT1 homolog n=1 Tax=Tetraparma gracilis TaxID=2962635 RepID=A0ABQ6MFY7_9STRA|nr:hypothetical protein TeGR_g542 [Tetraparma gracilis]